LACFATPRLEPHRNNLELHVPIKQKQQTLTYYKKQWKMLENSCIGGPWAACMCIGLLGLVWGEAQPLDYMIVVLLLKSIEQPFYPNQHGIRAPTSSTLMLTGPVAPTLVSPLRATRFSWVTTSSPGSRSVRMSSPVRALRQSIVSWPTAWQRRAGFVNCLWSYTTPYRGPL
jgi:hypothetical protein